MGVQGLPTWRRWSFINHEKFEIIDAFNHFIPRQFLSILPKPWDKNLIRQLGIRSVTDIEYRTRSIAKLGIHKQILSLGEQTILDDMNYPVKLLPKLARAANDGIASIVSKHSDHYYGVGTVTLYDVGEAIDELSRCVKDLGLLGVQVVSNVGGKPLDVPSLERFYDRLCHYGAGLWIHPGNTRQLYNWMQEYHLSSTLGWELDESLAMFRLVRSGVLERHPDLKVIIHHLGAMIPFYADRIQRSIMRDGKNGRPPTPLKKPAIDYFRMFYVDTVEGKWKPALVCSEMFYGPRRMVFATDFPFGPSSAGGGAAEIIRRINELQIPPAEKRMILGGNIRRLFKLK